MNRYDARENAFAVIFSTHFQKDLTIDEVLELYLESQKLERDEFFYSLVTATHQHLDEIDKLIKNNLNHWSINRISKVTLAALRLGVCELCYFEDVPEQVTIYEMVEIAKRYEGVKCGQFVNGVLSAVINQK